MAVGIFSSIAIGAMTSKTLGSHGQLNPAVTLLVATIEEQFEQVPIIIVFQLIGGVLASMVFLFTLWTSGITFELKKVFHFSNQKTTKTLGIEVLGNVFWYLPIAAMYIGLTVTKDIDFFQLLIIASLGKSVMIFFVISELGEGNFNPMVWFSKFLVTFIVQRKIVSKQLVNEINGNIASFLIGLACGGIGLFALQIA